MAKKLSKEARLKIEDSVDELFGKLKTRFLGPRYSPKKLYISFNREKSLPGLYEEAHIGERGIPDKEQLDQLLEVANNYLEASRLKAKSLTVVAVANWLQNKDGDLETVLGGELYDLYGKVSSDVKRILDTEAQNVRNVGSLDGIVRVNASSGVEDPVVFWVVVRDNSLCEECKRLHLLEDGKTPRVWKLSEVESGYHKKGESQPKVSGLHPHCRCSMTTLLPGFGFNKSGMVTWVKEGHDEYESQKG